MRRPSLLRVFATVACLLPFAVPSARSQGKQQEWTWKDEEGRTHTRAELDVVLKKHKEWVESHFKSGEPANLSRADLEGANLSGADLRHADLSGADLSTFRIFLQSSTPLGRALPSTANLSGADLSGAKLSRALLNNTDLSGAMLIIADLSGANLSDAQLKEAWLHGADLSGTIFAPNSLPELRGMAAAKNLELLTYATNPDALVQLRKQFQDGGFREQERKITYALKRREAEIAWQGCSWKRPWHTCATYLFNRVFFDWTCKYGLIPGRPPLLILGFCVLFSLIYWPLMHRRGPSGLYFVGKRTLAKGELTQGMRIFPRAIQPAKTKTEYVRNWIAREWRLARAALCFSILSAFNIGFREFNIGHWIRLLMPREYSLKAVGALRTIAGVQSLISVYLVALWILTYFGRPFD